MKIINKNEYNIMFGMEFIKPNEVKVVEDKIAKQLLNHPNIEEYVGFEEVKQLEDENAELKKKLALTEAKNKADKLGIKYNKNIGLDKLLVKIAEFEEDAK